jgi:hypothetical protein
MNYNLVGCTYFTFLFSNASTDHTARPIFTHDDSNDAVSREEVPFGFDFTHLTNVN